jgi:hypothetical protein
VDISHIAALNPINFFHTIGETLIEYSAKPKKRCWNINFNNKSFYLEFTPSVPLQIVPSMTLDSVVSHFRPEPEYIDTALAVVDTPTQKWKTSNPAGLTKWVDDIAKKQLIRHMSMDSVALCEATNVAPVPDQDVEITDTLRIAIRLFKRHRDMCARRGLFESDFKPISIIIVTLLTRCYGGMADLGRTYDHPVLLLQELAELMPGIVDVIYGKYHVDNPTVHGENFAERWNADDGELRKAAFFTWCEVLASDMSLILAAKSDDDLKRIVREVFGCPPESSEPSGGSGGSGIKTTSASLPPAAVRTPGLAEGS